MNTAKRFIAAALLIASVSACASTGGRDQVFSDYDYRGVSDSVYDSAYAGTSNGVFNTNNAY